MAAYSTANHPVDLVNYGERAWCRLETYMFMCVGEILMKPPLFFGFGQVPVKLCFGLGCAITHRWQLRKLTSGDTLLDAIEEMLDERPGELLDDRTGAADEALPVVASSGSVELERSERGVNSFRRAILSMARSAGTVDGNGDLVCSSEDESSGRSGRNLDANYESHSPSGRSERSGRASLDIRKVR